MPTDVCRQIQLGSLRSADEFYEAVDVYPFREEEVTVRTTDRFIVVSARHEERADDHGIVSRSFVRRIPLPDVSVHAALPCLFTWCGLCSSVHPSP